MRKLSSLILVSSFALLAAGCNQPGSSTTDFNLPEGDAEKGRQHFVALGCISCHTVRDIDLPDPEMEGPVSVMLGTRTRITSYGELVTSIVNPSHRLSPRYRKDEVSSDGESLMISNNDVMTVTQLTDLIAFLEPQYQKVSRPGYTYRTYDYSGTKDRSE